MAIKFIDAAHIAKGPCAVSGHWLPKVAGNAQKTSRMATIRLEDNKVSQRSLLKIIVGICTYA
jgi:hypothetical protein